MCKLHLADLGCTSLYIPSGSRQAAGGDFLQCTHRRTSSAVFHAQKYLENESRERKSWRAAQSRERPREPASVAAIGPPLTAKVPPVPVALSRHARV